MLNKMDFFKMTSQFVVLWLTKYRVTVSKKLFMLPVDQMVKKESACDAEDPGLIPGSGRSPGEGIGCPLQYYWASLVALMVKNPPAIRKTGVWSLGWEDPLEKQIHTPVLLPGKFHGQRSHRVTKSQISQQLSCSSFIKMLCCCMLQEVKRFPVIFGL